ncbi:unnamed protein product (macronuclear) [Paramecium tetraurelia]|uniref:Uncharacterized protein n=1 Tax=Paramecium tetraurelia TaxID=5888 RepID=A0BJF6_PARTE|nr:uncharacterized protein GSPATT00029300001 [Paramecium tetraurelia]CAK58673.1 unnamed protein product [Paramecium tetraurelia]|eukprot:XP_001426071.1 hypothetical protein (macronuclear) [Paramecium tetraurelia strain d4-2]
MLKFCYQSQEVYTFENYDNLMNSLSLDDFQSGKFDSPNNMITFNINHSRCIRLSDLLFYIQIDFVRIQFGQLLHLILSILKKVELIESQGLEHEYLDINRIWLYFKEESQYPGLIYQILHYSIHFTGYSCPLKYVFGVKQKASIQIQEIICQIINSCSNRIKQQKNKDKNKQICEEILEQIYALCKTNSSIPVIILYLENTICFYKEDKYIENKLVQLLNLDDTDIEPERQKVIGEVNNIIKQIIEIGNTYGQVCVELLLQDAITKITQNLSNFSFNRQSYETYAQNKFKQLQDQEQDLQILVEQQTKNLIIYFIQQYEKDFKFEIDEEEIIQLQQYIVKSILQSPQVRHYYNTYQYQKDSQINNYIFSAIGKIQQQIIKDGVESIFMYKILLLINDLI